MRVLLLATFAASAVRGQDKCPFFTKVSADGSGCPFLDGFEAPRNTYLMSPIAGIQFLASLTRVQNTCSAGFALGRICKVDSKLEDEDGACKSLEVYAWPTVAGQQATAEVEKFDKDCDDNANCSFAIDKDTYANACNNSVEQVDKNAAGLTLDDAASLPANGGPPSAAMATYNGFRRSVIMVDGDNLTLAAECCEVEACYVGYTYDAGTGMCKQNECTCEGGAAATGKDCNVDGAEICAPGACSETGFTRMTEAEVDLADVAFVGQDKTQAELFSSQEEVSYKGKRWATEIKDVGGTLKVVLAGSTCKKNLCECANGANVEGIECPTDGENVCFDAFTDGQGDQGGCNNGYGFQAKNGGRRLQGVGGVAPKAPSEQPTESPSQVPTGAPTPANQGECAANQCKCEDANGKATGTPIVGNATVNGNDVFCDNTGEQKCSECVKTRALDANFDCKETVTYDFLEGDGGREIVKGGDQGGAFVGEVIDKAKIDSIIGYGCAEGYVPRADLAYTVQAKDSASGLDLDLAIGDAVCVKAYCDPIDVDGSPVSATKVLFGETATYTCADGHEATVVGSDGLKKQSSTVEYTCVEVTNTRDYGFESNLLNRAADPVCNPMPVQYTYNNGKAIEARTKKFGENADIDCADGYGPRCDGPSATGPTLTPPVDAQTKVPKLVDLSAEKYCYVFYGSIEYGLEGGKAHSPTGNTGARTGDTFEYTCPTGFALNAGYDGPIEVAFDEQFGVFPGASEIVCKKAVQATAGAAGGAAGAAGGTAGVVDPDAAVTPPGTADAASSADPAGSALGSNASGDPQTAKANTAGMAPSSFRNNIKLDGQISADDKPAGLEPLYIVLIVGGVLMLAGCLIMAGIVRIKPDKDIYSKQDDQ